MIYISTACLRSRFIKDSVSGLAGMGFRHIELSGGTAHYENYLGDLVELKERYGLNYLVHNYFPPPREDFVLNLVSSDNGVHERSVALIGNAVALSEKIGAGLYSLHPGYTVEMSTQRENGYLGYGKFEGKRKEDVERLFYRRFDSILRGLPEGHTAIAVENLFPFSVEEDYSLFSRPEEITRFLDRYSDSPAVGLLLDLGHLNVASHYHGFDRTEFVARLFRDYPRKIFEIHLSENDGTYDHHGIPSPDSWQVAAIRENLAGDIPVTIEWHNTAGQVETLERLRAVVDVLQRQYQP
jgi:sugar phosphate isomerase/epimerase